MEIDGHRLGKEKLSREETHKTAGQLLIEFHQTLMKTQEYWDYYRRFGRVEDSPYVSFIRGDHMYTVKCQLNEDERRKVHSGVISVAQVNVRSQDLIATSISFGFDSKGNNSIEALEQGKDSEFNNRVAVDTTQNILYDLENEINDNW